MPVPSVLALVADEDRERLRLAERVQERYRDLTSRKSPVTAVFDPIAMARLED